MLVNRVLQERVEAAEPGQDVFEEVCRRAAATAASPQDIPEPLVLRISGWLAEYPEEARSCVERLHSEYLEWLLATAEEFEARQAASEEDGELDDKELDGWDGGDKKGDEDDEEDEEFEEFGEPEPDHPDWRRRRPTPGQLDYLRSLGDRERPPDTRGEACDRLQALLEDQAQPRLENWSVSPPTERQLHYLRRLGDREAPPRTLAQATERIARLEREKYPYGPPWRRRAPARAGGGRGSSEAPLSPVCKPVSSKLICSDADPANPWGWHAGGKGV